MPIHEQVKDGVVISRVEVPCSVEEVKAEAQRRIMALVGASSMEACMVKQQNAAMRAIELLDAKASRPLTSAEVVEEGALKALSARISAIRAASNVIEASPPAEVSLDPRWPA